MSNRVDLYDSTYGHFTSDVLTAVRQETYGTDIGQDSWMTVEEYDHLLSWLRLSPQHHLLDVASGSGGPALHIARTIGCRVTGIDLNEKGVAAATRVAADSNQADRVRFTVADASARLPFPDDSFDAIVCLDAFNHLTNRLAVLREWHRVLGSGRRAVFTDPVVITGPVTNDELATRSSIGAFLFVPPGVNEQLIAQAGFRLVQQEDGSDNAAKVSGRWHDARRRHEGELRKLEGDQRFEGLQRFLATVRRLTSERRLTRTVYLVEKAAA
jgi:SAM-dependent methyltransferase